MKHMSVEVEKCAEYPTTSQVFEYWSNIRVLIKYPSTVLSSSTVSSSVTHCFQTRLPPQLNRMGRPSYYKNHPLKKMIPSLHNRTGPLRDIYRPLCTIVYRCRCRCRCRRPVCTRPYKPHTSERKKTLQIHNNGYYTTKGLFTASRSAGEGDKDLREKKRTSKNTFAFASAFARCEWALNRRDKRVKTITFHSKKNG